MMKKSVFSRLHVVLICIGVMLSPQLFAKDPVESAQTKAKSAATESVQKEVDKKSTSKASEKQCCL